MAHRIDVTRLGVIDTTALAFAPIPKGYTVGSWREDAEVDSPEEIAADRRGILMPDGAILYPAMAAAMLADEEDSPLNQPY